MTKAEVLKEARAEWKTKANPNGNVTHGFETRFRNKLKKIGLSHNEAISEIRTIIRGA